MKRPLLASLACFFMYSAFPQSNNAPVAVNDTVEVMAQVPILIDALSNDYDPDGDSIFYETIKDPPHGEFDTINGIIRYKSHYSSNYEYDKIMYRITDNGSPPELSTYASIIIKILPNPDLPVAVADEYICTLFVPVELNILSNDYDLNENEFKINEIRYSSNCLVEINNDSLSVTVCPESEYSFAYFMYNVIESGTSESYISKEAEVRIGLVPNPDVPVPVVDYAVTTGGTPVIVPVLENDYDLQGDEFDIYNIASDPSLGLVSQENHTLIFTPKISIHGICSFNYNVYQIESPFIYSKYAQVHVEVSKNPDCPVGVPDFAAGMKCTEIMIDVLANDYDSNGDPLEIWSIDSGNDSSVISDNKIIYYSSNLAFDREVIKYRIRQSNDHEYYSDWIPVYINLEDNPAFPAAVDDHYTVNSLSPLVLSPLVNDIRNTADTIVLKLVHGYYQNKVSIVSDSLILYQPYTNLCTRDSVAYIISDKNNPELSSAGMIYLNIQDLNYYDSLTINKINAGVNADGLLFGEAFQFPGEGTMSYFNPHFKYPNGLTTNTIISSTIWIGGTSSNDSLYFAGERYRMGGSDFQPGPVSGSYDSVFTSRFWRLWKLKKSEVDYHRNHWFQENYQPIDAIEHWPGTGDIETGQAHDLAPYIDYNLDGFYDPMAGDYPLIRGDECIFFIKNDDKDHTESYGQRMKVEVHGMVYAFDAPEDSALANTVFVHYDIINRSDLEFHDTYLGIFTDIDLGNPSDDYIGSDVFRNSYYCYNGRAYDDSIANFYKVVQGYGKYPPAQSVTILSGPLLDADAQDNPAGECNYSFNGFNFGNEILDDERYGLTGFLFRNYSPINPIYAGDYYLLLKGYWTDSTRWVFGDRMHDWNPLAAGPACQFMFPGNSDTANFGTGCLLPNPPYDQAGFFWTDSSSLEPGDRNGLGIMGPFTFKPGDVQEIDLAYVVANGWNGPVSSIIKLMEYIDSLRIRVNRGEIIVPNDQLGVFENNGHSQKIKIFPNPVTARIHFILEGNQDRVREFMVYDIFGRNVLSGIINDNHNEFDVNGLSSGFYVLVVKTGNQIFSEKFIKSDSN